MNPYQRYLLPKLINAAMKAPQMARIRSQLIPNAKGHVLEVGIGSGLNLPYYNEGVSVTGVDPSPELQKYAREVADDSDTEVEFLTQGGESIPADDNTFDSVVVTWTLCSIPEPELALAEIRRVLKQTGILVFAEHGLSPDRGVSTWQHRLNPVWKVIGGGCHLNRKMDTLISSAGFSLDDMTVGYVPGPKFAAYMYRGLARPA